VATVAQLAGIGLYGGTMLEGGIGTAASPPVRHLCRPVMGHRNRGLLLTQEILREPLVYRDFMLQVPTGPGLGVQVDTDKLRHLARQ
jgi:muconate cycloisomerase